MTFATTSQAAIGVDLQKQIEARALAGTPECPNGCGLPYHPVLGHLAPGYTIAADEEKCLGILRVGLERDRDDRRERARLVELGQHRRHVIAFWLSLLLLMVLVALMVAHSSGPVPTSSGVGT